MTAFVLKVKFIELVLFQLDVKGPGPSVVMGLQSFTVSESQHGRGKREKWAETQSRGNPWGLPAESNSLSWGDKATSLQGHAASMQKSASEAPPLLMAITLTLVDAQQHPCHPAFLDTHRRQAPNHCHAFK